MKQMFQHCNTDGIHILQVLSATVGSNDIGRRLHSFGETTFYQLGIKCKGRTDVSYRDKNFVYDDNSVLYLPCESRPDIPYHKIYRRPGTGVCIFFTCAHPLPAEAKLYKFSNTLAANKFKEIRGAFKNGQVLKTKALFYEILDLLDEWDENEQKAQSHPTADILAYMQKHSCDAYIDLQELSARFGLSADYFRHKFQKDVGVSPKKYLSALKIKAAKDLLLNSELAVHEVAAAVGFSDCNYFTRFFKKETAYTPLSFRKSFKRYF